MQDFAGTDRIAVYQRLGSGGFGIVYSGFDRDRNIPVAIKTLRHLDPAALGRFKDEYRSLADIAHPNLITLHELMSDGDQWFFTMELVNGVDFLTYVHHEPAWSHELTSDSSAETAATPIDAEAATQAFIPHPAGSPSAPPHGAKLDRLRGALRQLAEGLDTLHHAGKLHGDIKPSNVLVTPEGRVVLLDFGLARDAPVDGDETVRSDTQLFGTPAYMAPELTLRQPAVPASDWYAVGVMLYEALTGRKPFSGLGIEQAMVKQQTDATPPSAVVAGVPPDLDALCASLLRRDPRARPSGAAILALLGSAPTRSPSAHLPRRASAFVGRTSEIDALDAAFQAVADDGRAVMVSVSGGPGVGKSALVRRFLDRLADRDPRAVILTGRCYESESVPYKAVDSLLDALCRHLQRLPSEQVAAVLPREVEAITRLFPVLGSVPAIANAPRKVAAILDSVELRRRAFLALRELFQRLADRSPLVLFIDDLHWGDLDSAALIAELLRPPDSPALLLLTTFRASERTTAPVLIELMRLLTQMPALDARAIALAELTAEDARGLAMSLLAADGRPASADAARRLAEDAGGNPLFIGELARHQPAGESAAGVTAGASLEQVIRARVAALPESARVMLELVVTAGQPVEVSVIARAAATGTIDERVLAQLRSARLIRGSGAGGGRLVEAYHDRIREVLTTAFAPDHARGQHLRIAEALEVAPDPDPERLALHFQRGGAVDRAVPKLIEAADRAAGTLAFEHAAGLYRQALELRPPDTPAARRHLLERLGSALANAGSGVRAADAFLAASREAADDAAIDLTRRAAQHFLMSGHIEPGLEALQSVLEAAGLTYPPSPKRALASLLFTRLRLDLRGYRFRERPANQVPAEHLRRIDACWAVAAGLGNVDAVRSAMFGARHMLFALHAGEPYRVARALSAEVSQRATGGHAMRHKCRALMIAARTLVDRIDDPPLTGLHHVMSGVSEHLMGRWTPALERLQAGETILREQCAGVAWELATCHLYLTRTLYWLGDVAELCRRLPRLLEEATERGDLFGMATLRARAAYLTSLAAGDPTRAREECRLAIEHWTRKTFHIEHYFALVGQTEIDLYVGDGAAAWARVSEAWPALTHSLLTRVQLVRVQSTHLRGRAAVLAARQEPEGSRRRQLLATATRDARGIEREGAPVAAAIALLLRGSIAATRGDVAQAIEHFRRAEEQCLAQDMRLHMIAAQRARGLLVGGDEGRALVDSAGEWMAGQSISDPDRFARVLGT